MGTINVTFKVCIDTCKDKTLWRQERLHRITGSRCYELFTYMGTDWLNKIQKYFNPKPFQTKATRHGLQYESAARDLYAKHCNLTIVQTGLVVCHNNPWLAFSPDGVIFENRYPTKLLEIKCPYKGMVQLFTFS